MKNMEEKVKVYNNEVDRRRRKESMKNISANEDKFGSARTIRKNALKNTVDDYDCTFVSS